MRTTLLFLIFLVMSPSQASVCDEAMEVFIKKDYARALTLSQQAPEVSPGLCQTILGHLYFQGKGVNQDMIHGMTYYEIAAGQSETLALFTLGVIYEKGKHVAFRRQHISKYLRTELIPSIEFRFR